MISSDLIQNNTTLKLRTFFYLISYNNVSVVLFDYHQVQEHKHINTEV